MIIDCIGCLHGFLPKLDGGDLLIVTGDLTAKDNPIEYINFYEWCKDQYYEKIIIISGNHDIFIENLKSKFFPPTTYYSHCEYLCDSGTEFEVYKIWGSPWTAQFPGINPKCTAFTVPYGPETEIELNKKWEMIPDDIDILITHGPPNGILDAVGEYDKGKSRHVGSTSLREHVIGRIKPKLHIFGHIHEWGGKQVDLITTRFINCSIMKEKYQPVNKPIRIIL